MMSSSHSRQQPQPAQSTPSVFSSMGERIVPTSPIIATATTTPSAHGAAATVAAASAAASSSPRHFLFGGGISGVSVESTRPSWNNCVSLSPPPSLASPSFTGGVGGDGALLPRNKRRHRKRQKTMEESFQQLTLVGSYHDRSSMGDDFDDEDSSEDEYEEDDMCNDNMTIDDKNKAQPYPFFSSSLPLPGARRRALKDGEKSEINDNAATTTPRNPVDERLEEMIRLSRLKAYVADQKLQKKAEEKVKNKNNKKKDVSSSSMVVVRARDDFDVGWQHKNSQSSLLSLGEGQKGYEKKRRCNGRKKNNISNSSGINKSRGDGAKTTSERGRTMLRSDTGTRSLSLPREYKQVAKEDENNDVDMSS